MALGVIIVIVLLLTGVIEFAALHWSMRMLEPYSHASFFVLTECVVAVVVPLMLVIAALRALRRTRGLDSGQSFLLGIFLLLLMVFGVSLSMKEITRSSPPGSNPDRAGQHL